MLGCSALRISRSTLPSSEARWSEGPGCVAAAFSALYNSQRPPGIRLGYEKTVPFSSSRLLIHRAPEPSALNHCNPFCPPVTMPSGCHDEYAPWTGRRSREPVCTSIVHNAPPRLSRMDRLSNDQFAAIIVSLPGTIRLVPVAKL